MNEDLIDKIYEIASENCNDIELGDRLYTNMFNKCDLDKKINLLCCQGKYLGVKDITDSLNKMGEPYSKISMSRSREKIEYSDSNNKLAKALKENGYISSWSYAEKYGKRWIQFNAKEREKVSRSNKK